jgi:hypothetical protein
MNLGQLRDLLRELEDAERDVLEAKDSLAFGGSAKTVEGKQGALLFAEWQVKALRSQQIFPTPDA